MKFEVYDTQDMGILPPSMVAITGSGVLLIYRDDQWHVTYSNRYRITWRA